MRLIFLALFSFNIFAQDLAWDRENSCPVGDMAFVEKVLEILPLMEINKQAQMNGKALLKIFMKNQLRLAQIFRSYGEQMLFMGIVMFLVQLSFLIILV